MNPTMPAASSDASQTLDVLLPPVLPVAFRAAYHLTRDRADAEDIVQEAALNACRGFHTFEPGTNFKAWFLRIVTNVFLMRCRSEKRAGDQVSLDDEDGMRSVEAEAWASDRGREDPLLTTLARLDSEAISAALQELPEDYRTVAVMYFVDDLPYQTIARIVGCPVGTVRSRLHRARRILTLRLRHLAREGGVVVGRETRAVRRELWDTGRASYFGLAPA